MIESLLEKPSENFCSDPSDPAHFIAGLAYEAMLLEVLTTPKPGLVDQANSGSHKDMNLSTFIDSAGAIQPWLNHFVSAGMKTAHAPAETVLASIRPQGIACEQAMFSATNGVNTHKGMIFSMAIVLAAAGRQLTLEGKEGLNSEKLCDQVAAMTAGLIERELSSVLKPRTAGERLFQQFGLTGIRGEVESGFATVRQHALPVLTSLLKHGPRNIALLQTLLHLMAHNNDTNIVSRGGMLALKYTQKRARSLLKEGGVLADNGLASLHAFDRDMIARNLSPGGSADLLALTWLMHRLETISSPLSNY
ncbi:triphosphoribosyl-dephospho-CoA synthase CitG [Endozoicomonas gorgoniicola]|uniref:Probable 2-(5''-triphosphoribosyl)-3'-dephosphocoenzyme-A synthase n=1 Tax=Endozoicomonas gorgoniicola TaxID=1234144 RepID=A0ABT3MZ87_9GAMM|nr:triphosphoribosyl-dephospho-CoA synthase CitG [Endozoicomonas gorgoniicola]MCW7554689.1 triphosphoribosyl-dephospho-CoA synthase CitG [Endozoicomonas gorgoniicola]